MRAAPPDVNLDGSISVALADDFQALRRNRRDWSFRKTKRRKHGYYPGEIAKKVAAQEGVRVRRVVRGKHRLTKLVRKDATALDVLREAYVKEHEKTGLRFILRMARWGARDRPVPAEPGPLRPPRSDYGRAPYRGAGDASDNGYRREGPGREGVRLEEGGAARLRSLGCPALRLGREGEELREGLVVGGASAAREARPREGDPADEDGGAFGSGDPVYPAGRRRPLAEPGARLAR